MSRPLALIIGASGPVGQAATRSLAKTHRIAATSRRGVAGLTGLVDDCLPFQLEALEDASWQRLLASLPQAPQTVIHCIGDFALIDLDQMNPEHFDALISSNLQTAFRTYHYLGPRLRTQTKSSLLYFGLAHSQSSQAEPRISAYYAAKQGLCSLVKSIALQEAKHGLACSMIAPGFVAGAPQPSTTTQEPVPETQLMAAIEGLTGPLAQQLSGTILDLSGGWRLR